MKTLAKKQILLVFASLLFASTSYGQWKSIKGNGNMTSVTRTTDSYDAISCAGSMDFILVSGNEGSIKIEGEENLLEYIITEVKDNKLKVKVKNGKNLKSSKNKTIKIKFKKMMLKPKHILKLCHIFGLTIQKIVELI